MSSAVEFLSGVVLNEERFMSLLEKLIGESEFLQNSPPQGLIPCEDKASNHVLDVLSPFMVQNGGVLIVERVTFVEGL
jgi:acetylornithine deacetylase